MKIYNVLGPDSLSEPLRGPLNDRVTCEREAALYFGVSGRTLRQWRDEGAGPAYVKLGGKRIGYVMSDLNAFIEANRVVPNTEAARV